MSLLIWNMKNCSRLKFTLETFISEYAQRKEKDSGGQGYL